MLQIQIEIINQMQGLLQAGLKKWTYLINFIIQCFSGIDY